MAHLRCGAAVAVLMTAVCLAVPPRYAAAHSASAAAVTGAIHSAAVATQVCDVTKYGAVGDGKSINTKAIQAAIAACASAGGGTVYVCDSLARVQMRFAGPVTFAR